MDGCYRLLRGSLQFQFEGFILQFILLESGRDFWGEYIVLRDAVQGGLFLEGLASSPKRGERAGASSFLLTQSRRAEEELSSYGLNRLGRFRGRFWRERGTRLAQLTYAALFQRTVLFH